eukprot:scaffold7011_cov112-Isochrysis_galbana.AAC.6
MVCRCATAQKAEVCKAARRAGPATCARLSCCLHVSPNRRSRRWRRARPAIVISSPAPSAVECPRRAHPLLAEA